MEDYNLSSWGINSQLNGYREQTCKILDIKNQFRKSNLDNNFNQIEFQYSKVNFKEKYKEHINKSKYINLILNTQIINLHGQEKLTTHVECIFNKKNIRSNQIFLFLQLVELKTLEFYYGLNKLQI